MTTHAKTRNAFSWRAFTTFSMVLVGLFLAVSGLIMFVAPAGRVANWTGWNVLGLTKHEWTDLHAVFAILFITASVLHLYFNWKVLLHYLRNKVRKSLNRGRELATATLLGTLILIGTLAGVPPFSTVLSIGSTVAARWEQGASAAPIPHAEALTLSEYAAVMGLETPALMERMTEAGLTAESSGMTVAQAATRNNLTPQALQATLGLKAVPGSALSRVAGGTCGSEHTSPAPAQGTVVAAATYGQGSGYGYGQMTVSDLCLRLDMPLETALDKLADAGISATGGSNLRALADSHGKRPGELVAILDPAAGH